MYYGESLCVSCKGVKKNKAYYKVGDKYVCGVHSRNVDRIELPKRPAAELKLIKEAECQRRDNTIEEAKRQNELAGKVGDVILTKMYMMKEPAHRDGYMSVFPNYKHGHRKDGFGCMRLSPKALGPVQHGQPGLPDALNIENFHQFSKVFPAEVDANGDPTPIYYQNRMKGYLDPVPHRHKFKGVGNIPLYFIWVDDSGEHRLDYVTSRQFYCNFYQRLAELEDDYIKLRAYRASGYNLNIIGYDANPIISNNYEETVREIEREYLDPKRPFGHEKVLYAMLVLEKEDYPWIKYKTFHF